MNAGALKSKMLDMKIRSKGFQYVSPDYIKGWNDAVSELQIYIEHNEEEEKHG